MRSCPRHYELREQISYAYVAAAGDADTASSRQRRPRSRGDDRGRVTDAATRLFDTILSPLARLAPAFRARPSIPGCVDYRLSSRMIWSPARRFMRVAALIPARYCRFAYIPPRVVSSPPPTCRARLQRLVRCRFYEAPCRFLVPAAASHALAAGRRAVMLKSRPGPSIYRGRCAHFELPHAGYLPSGF